jgi:hypothetical protein
MPQITFRVPEIASRIAANVHQPLSFNSLELICTPCGR